MDQSELEESLWRLAVGIAASGWGGPGGGWWVVGGGVGTAEIKFKKILRQDDMNNFTSYNVHSQPATETGYDS